MKHRIAALLAGGAVAVGAVSFAVASSFGGSSVGPVDSLALGTKVSALDKIQDLPKASDTEALGLALDGVGQGQQASEARVLVRAEGAEVGVVGAPSERVCFATAGYRYFALCRDRGRLLEGRTVISVPLEPLSAATATTQKRIDFFVVPDEVASVTTTAGTAPVVGNVASVERPNGGPVGSVVYTLDNGKSVRFEFASVTPDE